MNKFFVFGDRKMMYLNHVVSQPNFGGFISESAQNLDFERSSLEKISGKAISLKDFLVYSKINGATLVLYFNDIVGANNLRGYLSKLQKKFNFVIKDFYEFVVDNNIPLIYENSGERRDKILSRKSDWINLSNHMTDRFSKESILAFLKATESKSMLEMIPVVTPFEFEAYNKYSNHYSFVPSDDEVYIDVGAYDGDSVAKFIECTPTGNYRAIHAFEPNPSTYAKLEKIKSWIPRLETYQIALSDKNQELNFKTEGGSMGARFSEANSSGLPGEIAVKACRLDSVIEKATIVKIDVEGFECDVLKGAERLIQTSTPDIIVDTYHYANDALAIFDTVKKIHDYKYIGMRFPHANMSAHSLYFSNRTNLI
jgi:FkbM family methyltransferase